MHLPVAAREIRVAAFDRASYRSRVWTAALAIIATVWILYGLLNFTGRFNYSVGAQIFAIQSWAAFFFAAGAMQITHDAISREKRDGTLGLLFLTHLKGHDVVLGKLIARMALHFSAALATLPILALPILLGGVYLAQSFHLILSLLNCMLFSASAGLLASSICVQRRRAASLAVLIVMVFCIVLPILSQSMRYKRLYPDLCLGMELITPLYAQILSPGAIIGPQKTFFYLSLAIVFLISCGFLTAASFITPHSWQIRERPPFIGGLRKKFAAGADQTIPSRSPLGRKLLDVNAYEWLSARRTSAAIDAWSFIILIIGLAAFLIWYFSHNNDPAAVLIMVCLPAATIILLNVKVRIGGHACDRFCEDRETNALELILSTPMTIPKMIAGQFRALRRLYLLPLLFTFALLFVAWYLCLGGVDRIAATFSADSDQDIYHTRSFVIACWLAFFLILDTFTLVWVGSWLSFRLPKIPTVRGSTMALTFFGPFAGFAAMMAIIENSPPPIRYLLRDADFYQIGFILGIFALGGDLLLIRHSRKFLLGNARQSLSKHDLNTREFPNPFASLTRLNFLRPKSTQFGLQPAKRS